MTKHILFLAFAFFQCTLLFSQITHFPFDTDFNDVVNDYNPTTFGNPEIITDDGNQVLQLEGDEYLSLPDEVHQAINPDQNLEIQIKFKISNTYTDAPYAGTGAFGEEGKRVLISNKENDIFAHGFDIFVSEADEEYRVLMSFGDDTESGGTFIFNEAIEENEWVELKLILRLNNETPSIAYKINGYYSHFPLNYLDVGIFKESLNTQQIWVGTDTDNAQGFDGFAFAETSIDYIKIFNPPFVGNSALVANSLNALANHLNVSAPLQEGQQKSHLNTIVANWDDNTYAAISADILNYMTTYEQEEGTVFETYAEYVNPKEVEVPRSLQFMLIQWMIDNLYTPSNAANMENISFLDHEIMPGPVNPAAPRITASTMIDGTYNTNPGYFLNQQAFVIRPTGYYAAPGELVEITFPEAMVNQGVKVHVGAHFIDIREDFVGFQRFPTIATRFDVENTTLSVVNPFGGALYIILPDGSNFGAVDIEFGNAVKSPYFSTKTGFENRLADYQTDLENDYVGWVDIESDNFMCTFPKSLANAAPNADDILTPFNTMIAQYNVLGGRPLTKIRSEYVISEPQLYSQGTYPASYPMSIPNGDLEEVDMEAIPISVLDPAFFMSSYDGTTILHELGHLHSFPTMFEEGETNVEIPSVIAFEAAFGVPLDTGLYYGNHFQKLDGDKAALDWLLDPKFRKFEPAEYPDVSYQTRGTAKYVDVARLFSWETLGLIHQHWYELYLNGDEPAQGIEYVSPDEYIEVASDQLDFNFAPLWELWGSIPSNELIEQLASYEQEDKIKERILYYRSLVPPNAAAFQTVYDAITPNIEEHHKERYDLMLNYYDESVADSIFARIDDILCKYFPPNCGQTATTTVRMRAMLQGAYDAESGLMTTNPNISNQIPISQPFNRAPWNYNGEESVASIDVMPSNVTDWVLIEVRSSNDVNTVVSKFAKNRV